MLLIKMEIQERKVVLISNNKMKLFKKNPVVFAILIYGLLLLIVKILV